MFRRNKNQSVQVVEEQTGLDLLDQDGKIITAYPPEVIANVRQMITRIEARGAFPASLGLVSALRQEGVTYLAHALGLTVANDFATKVCVVGLNWWEPEELFDGPGLASVVAGDMPLAEACLETGHPNLFVLPPGVLPLANRSMVARSQALKEVVKGLKQRFQHVIFDVPAVLNTSEAINLAGLADNVCVVVRQGVTSATDVRQAMDYMGHLPVLGVVMNQVKTHTPEFIMRLLPSE